ncbi:MAG: type II toxin-antitoxin system RelE/ParE family toxin [Coriobacteriia bacterium]|nr:type II toxin-antitoxin system RelE/ParE family toxin [Coriobacteriia bacterium]
MIEVRQTRDFRDWLRQLKDPDARDRIVMRLRRLSVGNPGDVKPVGGGVWEMRIDCGPGYRLYFTWRGDQVVVLLAGGNKSTQQRDIRRAQELAWRP